MFDHTVGHIKNCRKAEVTICPGHRGVKCMQLWDHCATLMK